MAQILKKILYSKNNLYICNRVNYGPPLLYNGETIMQCMMHDINILSWIGYSPFIYTDESHDYAYMYTILWHQPYKHEYFLSIMDKIYDMAIYPNCIGEADKPNEMNILSLYISKKVPKPERICSEIVDYGIGIREDLKFPQTDLLHIIKIKDIENGNSISNLFKTGDILGPDSINDRLCLANEIISETDRRLKEKFHIEVKYI